MSNHTQLLHDASVLLDASQDTGDSGRNQIKAVLRRVIATSSDSWVQEFIADNDKFESMTGRSLGKAIDYTNRNQLHHVANCILDLGLGDEYDFDYDIEQLQLWMKSYQDSSICNNKVRGKGKSLGWHKDCPDRDQLHNATALTIGVMQQQISNEETGASPMTTKTYTSKDISNVVYALADKEGVAFDSSTILPIATQVIATLGDSVDASVSASQVTSMAIIRHQAGNELTPSERADALNMATGVVVESAPEPERTANESAEYGIVDPSMLPAVNALLKQAIGDVTLEQITKSVEQSNETIRSLREQLNLAENQLQDVTVQSAIATSGETEVDGDTLKYEVVYRNASELFLDPNGNEVEVLKFKVPTLVWFDSDGVACKHPDTPTIDTKYQFRLKHLIKALTAFVHGKNMWAHGHTSSGKTTLFEQIAARLGFPIEVLNLDGQLERADMVGHTEIEVENGSPVTRFREGILPRAMQKPCMFILDEIDAGRPDVLFVVQRALEGKGLAVTEDAGRHIKPHDLFRFCATANSRGQGDEHGWYQGVRPMNLSLLNRFGAFIEVPYLDFDDELRLLKNKFPKLKAKVASQLAQFCKDIQKAFTSGELSTTLAPRNLHAMAEYYMFFTQHGMSDEQALTESLEMCVIDGCPADNQQRIREIANRILKV